MDHLSMTIPISRAVHGFQGLMLAGESASVTTRISLGADHIGIFWSHITGFEAPVPQSPGLSYMECTAGQVTEMEKGV